jgi:hypothetical protein
MNTVKQYIYAGIGTIVTARSALAIDPFGNNEVDTDLR